MRSEVRNWTPLYALIQALYWATYCMMLNFASVFLLDRGFTNGQIGIILGSSYLLSACLQPVMGAFFTRHDVRLNVSITCVYIPIALLALSLRMLPLARAELAVIVVIVFSSHSMMQPSINSLPQSLEHAEGSANFGLARGIGSAVFAVTSLLVGQLLKWRSASILPGLYFGTVVALMAALTCFRVPSGFRVNDAGGSDVSYFNLLQQYPHFGYFLLGVMGMFMTHMFIESFLAQIIMKMGGSSANLGVAIMLSSMTELPAMVLYTRFCKKERGLKVLNIAVWCWVAKDMLTLLVRSPRALYAVQLLNFFGNAVYIPAMLDYVRHALPGSLFLRGVALAGTANTIGGLLATVIGGWLLDRMGVTGSLMLMQAFALSGAVLLTIAIRGAKGNKSLSAGN